jgi:hypothetical protein
MPNFTEQQGRMGVTRRKEPIVVDRSCAITPVHQARMRTNTAMQ